MAPSQRPPDRWHPSVTVAAVIADGARYLLVEERTPEGLRLNQPAGHLDPGESPLEGAVREALEETARRFVPEALLGVYLARFQRPGRDGAPDEDITYLRFAFCGTAGDELPGRRYDAPIERTLWLTAEEIEAERARWRSPLVGRCVADHRAGRRFALDAVTADPSLTAPFVPR